MFAGTWQLENRSVILGYSIHKRRWNGLKYSESWFSLSLENNSLYTLFWGQGEVNHILALTCQYCLELKTSKITKYFGFQIQCNFQHTFLQDSYQQIQVFLGSAECPGNFIPALPLSLNCFDMFGPWWLNQLVMLFHGKVAGISVTQQNSLVRCSYFPGNFWLNYHLARSSANRYTVELPAKSDIKIQETTRVSISPTQFQVIPLLFGKVNAVSGHYQQQMTSLIFRHRRVVIMFFFSSRMIFYLQGRQMTGL